MVPVSRARRSSAAGPLRVRRAGGQRTDLVGAAISRPPAGASHRARGKQTRLRRVRADEGIGPYGATRKVVRRGGWSGLPRNLAGPRCGPARQAAAGPLRSLALPQAALPCGPHPPANRRFPPRAGGKRTMPVGATISRPCRTPDTPQAAGPRPPRPFVGADVGIHMERRRLTGKTMRMRRLPMRVCRNSVLSCDMVE